MKKLALLLVLAVSAFGQSNDLGVEILAPSSVPWHSGTQVIIRASSYGPDQFPSATLTMNVGLHGPNVTPPTWSGSGWTCSFGQGMNLVSGICSRVGITTGTFPDLVLNVAVGREPLRVGANVSGGTANDPGPHPNDAEVTIGTVPPSTLEVVASASPNPAYARDVVTYTYTITNHGPQPSNNVRLQISNCCGEPGPTFLGISAEGSWTCGDYNPGLYQVACTIPTLPVGPAPSITMTVQMPFEGGTFGSGIGVFADLTESEVTPVFLQGLPKSDLSVEVTGATTAAPNSVVQHSVNVSNGGPSTATSLSVSLGGPSIVGLEGDGWSCADEICTRASLEPQDTAPPIVVTSQTPGSGTMLVSATVTSATDDLEPMNDTASIAVDVDAAMSIAAISPTSGSTAGGTSVTITGHGFTPQTGASFDNVRVPTVYVSATQLIATTRAHAPGAVDVAVVNPDDTVATLTKAFTFEAPGRGRRRASRH